MARTAFARTPSLPPCMLAPELWDSSENAAAIAACRRQCPRRFACAQEALAGPKHLVSSLNGVIAGVAIPQQNEYGTSKAHKAALKRLETIAALGAAASAASQRCARSQLATTPAGHDDARTSSAATQGEPSVEGEEFGPAHTQPSWDRQENTEVVLGVPPGDWGAEVESCYRKPTPKGQVDIAGAARMTGLTVETLRTYRQLGRGPTSWLTPGGPRGVVRYWVTDVQAWMAHRQLAGTTPTASAS